MDLGLTDRVYLVPGGSRGLGRAAAEALVADGARVVISARGATAFATVFLGAVRLAREVVAGGLLALAGGALRTVWVGGCGHDHS